MTSGEAVRIRAAGADDAGRLHALIVALADHHGQREFVRCTPAGLQRDIAGPAPRLGALIAEVDGRDVGYVSWIWFHSIWLGDRVMNIDDLFVDAAVRGRGVGEALMHAARAACREHGAPRLRWEVQTDNAAAIRFYERLGARMRTKGLFAWDAVG